jgi:uncharacterized phage protein gp47/JayE
MAYEPRNKTEILRELAARVVNRTDLTDVLPGSVLHTILSTVAEEFASTEYRLGEIRDSFFLEGASGSDLDERAAEMPARSISRLRAVPASGQVTITRDDTSAAFTLDAGGLFGRKDNSKIFYRTLEDVTFAIGEGSKTISVTCTTSGEEGNVSSGNISIVVAQGNISTVTNEAAFTSGANEETDDSLRSRLRAYLASLSRSQDLALEFEALNFQASNGKRFTSAKLVLDPEVPGYTELLVDDGTGLANAPNPRFITENFDMTIPDPAVRRLRVMQIPYVIAPSPSIVAPSGVRLWISPEGTTTPPVATNNAYRQLTEGVHYIAIPERGLIYFLDAAYDQNNSTGIHFETDMIIRMPGYNVKTFTDSPSYIQIDELQRLIEGDPNNPTSSPGMRAAGTRVNSDLELGQTAVELAASDFVNNLAPGEPLYLNRLVAHLINSISDLVTANILSEDGQAEIEDFYTQDERHVLRAGNIEVQLIGG